LATTLVGAALAGTAQAGLIDRGGGMIYDTTLDITWLADWNYASTSGFDADGAMNWTTANSWANNLVYGGFSDWRLPSSLNANGSGPCGPAFNCTGSEMGHMFYVNWGATANNSFSTGTNAANLALFSNVVSFIYWSGTEYAPNQSEAWFFNVTQGAQANLTKIGWLFAVAVRPGDVTASVPEPQSLALVLLGLGAGMVARRRRPR
jgi:hypothetical protein